MSSNKFGRYEIRGEIGRGGMATVFQAYDPRFERDVAIKVLPREFLHDSQFRVRFEREAKTVALLEHPAIVPVYDFGEEEGQPYIVMRYMSGGSLSERLRQGALPASEVLNIFNRLAPALDAAHARGIIHRDLKPGNILFDQYGNSFLSDFGIARLAQTGGATLTGGNILGTPAYMSPEQVQGDKEIDGRSDIYAMGVILFQLLSGNAPYQATTPARVMMMHILEPVPNILTIRPNLPNGVEKVIAQAMAKEPAERYNNLTEMANALAALFSNPPSTPIPAAYIPPADATMVAGSKTEIKPLTKPPQKTVIQPREAKEKAQAVSVEKRGMSFLPIILVGLVIVAILAAAGGTGFLYLQNTANARSTEVAAQLANVNNKPTNTAEPTSAPTLTFTPQPEPSETPTEAEVVVAPTETSEPSPTAEPSVTPTEAVAARPVIGGSDQIAFISNNDIWVANVDGSELRQLTNDRAEKLRLHWLPDGSGLVYIQGKCIRTVTFEGGVQSVITCLDSVAYLEDFQVSPDGSQVAISLDHEFLFVVPFDIAKLQEVRVRGDLTRIATCNFFAPYGKFFFRSVRWSTDSKLIAMNISAPISNIRQDTIVVRDFSRCVETPARVGVEFPASYFTIKGYVITPLLGNYGWDGRILFALTGAIRNGGYGDFYIFNTELNRADLEVNPIAGNCCYRDPSWSPDGRYLTFAYQAISATNKIELYLIPYGSIGTGEVFQPIPLPENFFANRQESPQPVLRPAVKP